MNEVVLVVDDEADQRALMRRWLEAEGFRVFEAEDGEEALQSLRTLDPMIIVLDLQMPRVDGLAFLEARETEGLAPLAEIIIHSSALSMPTPPDVHRVPKPIARESFRRLLRDLRERPREHGRVRESLVVPRTSTGVEGPARPRGVPRAR